jgi:hypothetical protein
MKKAFGPLHRPLCWSFRHRFCARRHGIALSGMLIGRPRQNVVFDRLNSISLIMSTVRAFNGACPSSSVAATTTSRRSATALRRKKHGPAIA